jgi:cysteine desulfurase
MKAYLDNGATTRTASEVWEAMKPYFLDEYGNASSLHQWGRNASEALEKARAAIAFKLNASPGEIIFTSGGTESDNLAIKGIAHMHKKGHIISSKIEHPAVLRTCEALEKEGYRITYLNVDREGFVDLSQLEMEIRPETILVSVMHGNNEIGVVEDISTIGSICAEHDIPFHTDAVQSFTKEPLDVKKRNVDLISLSSHKIHGPKGVGALFVREGTQLKKLVDGGAHEFNIRAGTENVAGVVGFAKAAEIANEGHVGYMRSLRDRLIENVLRKIPSSHLNGPRQKRLCNNANFSFPGIEGESLILYLDNMGIAASTGSACASKSLHPSHVLEALGVDPEMAHSSLRLTLSRYTTQEEIDFCVDALQEIVEKLREISPRV